MRLLKIITLSLLLLILTIPTTNAVYQDQEISLNNTFTAGCWSPPTAPELTYPLDGTIAGLHSTWDQNPYMDWEPSSFVCPGESLTYQYESYRDLNLTQLAYRSSWLPDSQIPASGTPEGSYYWRVKAKDSQGRESSWSTAWSLTVDRTPPTTLLSFNSYQINETVVNGGFETGLTGWNTQGKVVYSTGDAYASPYNGSTGMVRIGHRTALTGKEVWDNKISQQLSPGAKNLSFYYNFFSFDAGLWDDPGMVVRLNDYNVFYLSAEDINDIDSPNSSGWKQLSFDISQIDDPVLEISLYSGNTLDEFTQSWVYIDNISTSEAVAVDSTNFDLTAADNLSGVLSTHYSLDNGLTWHSSNSFDLSTVTGETTVWYYSVDAAGNQESQQTKRLVKDIQAPATITDLLAVSDSKQTIELSWTVPNDLPNHQSPTAYDIRYAPSPITDDSIFAVSASVPNPPAPRQVGETQSFMVSGLDANTPYYFAIKSTDAALNWSDISNLTSSTTLNPTTEDPTINPGDVVINELMWMGTSLSQYDEYLELRNLTDQVIDLSGWQLTKNTNSGEALMYTLPTLTTIDAHGYLLISEYDKDHSKLNVDPDLIVGAGHTNNGNFALRNQKMQFKLYNGDWTTSTIIDTADNATSKPAAGNLDNYYSMERDNTPGDGTQASSWHTTFADTSAYWDAGASEKGTPGGPNLSQPVPTQLELKLDGNNLNLDLFGSDLEKFDQLEYQVEYQTKDTTEAVFGKLDLNHQSNYQTQVYLGTCSTHGTCTPHQNLSSINVKVVLKGLIQRNLEKTLDL